MADLKRCPFCNGTAFECLEDTGKYILVYIMCGSCRCGTKQVRSKYNPREWNICEHCARDDSEAFAEVAEAWNRRYEPQGEIEFDYGAEAE